ncbi:phage scaffolding protein [Paenibacillus abyssi]|uniref:Scaffold protein n=1 Tax=Paenibacillus abyssi TaxID=1340531 RepID=A0A917CKC0_9BACL|nr:scaffolding protein [Paenibacillus abyssi]GGF88419.1 scaffold protein [Paenibacillus abyssi]
MRRFINAMSGNYTPYQLLDADGDNGGGDNGGDDDGKEKRTVTMTQADLDALIAREKGRVKGKYADYDDLKTKLTALEQAEEERKKAAMSEAERLKAEKDEADRKAAEASDAAKRAQDAANQRIINTEIRSEARALNANDASDVLSFVDKTKVTIDDEGNVIGAKEAVEAVKAAKPYLFKAPVGADAGDGGNPDRNRDKSELAAKEAELAELKKAAVRDTRLLGKVTALYNEILTLKAKR